MTREYQSHKSSAIWGPKDILIFLQKASVKDKRWQVNNQFCSNVFKNLWTLDTLEEIVNKNRNPYSMFRCFWKLFFGQILLLGKCEVTHVQQKYQGTKSAFKCFAFESLKHSELAQSSLSRRRSLWNSCDISVGQNLHSNGDYNFFLS